MEQREMKELLQQVAEGNATVDEALLKMKMAPFEEIDIASLDHHRGIRQGASEVIYGAGKTPAQIDKIAHTLWNSGQKTILITRMSQEAAETFEKDIPFTYYEEAKVGLVGEMTAPKQKGYILVATGGTSDIPVAEEAALTAEILGNRVERIYDVGVAGIHRLLAHAEKIMECQSHYRHRGDGRGAGIRHRRSGGLSCHRGAYQRRLWHCLRRRDGPFFPCSTPAPAASAWSTSTTASERLSGKSDQQYGGG